MKDQCRLGGVITLEFDLALPDIGAADGTHPAARAWAGKHLRGRLSRKDAAAQWGMDALVDLFIRQRVGSPAIPVGCRDRLGCLRDILFAPLDPHAPEVVRLPLWLAKLARSAMK